MKCKSYFGDYKCYVPTNIRDSRGNIVYVDKCIKEVVENLNEQGLKTVASCCGHGVQNPTISIEELKTVIPMCELNHQNQEDNGSSRL
jgi:hypothetical protein